MSGLIRLYPEAWRDRYEAEFLALLETRPPTFGDRFDIIRGAIDARIHPQVRRAPEDPVMTDERAADLVIARRLGYGSLVGAVLWIVTWFVAINGPLVVDGIRSYHDGAAAMPLYMLSVALLVGGLIGQLLWLPHSARLARAGFAIAMPFLCLWAFGPWLLFAFIAATLGLVALAIGAARAHAWPVPVSVLLAASSVGLSVLFYAAMANSWNPSQELGAVLIVVLTLPLWLVVGGTLVVGLAGVHATRGPDPGPAGPA